MSIGIMFVIWLTAFTLGTRFPDPQDRHRSRRLASGLLGFIAGFLATTLVSALFPAHPVLAGATGTPALMAIILLGRNYCSRRSLPEVEDEDFRETV